MPSSSDLPERYVALWNEPDPARRGDAVRALWTEDGCQILDPPQEICELASSLGFSHPILEARGHAALEQRVAAAYERFVAAGEASFRLRAGATQVGQVLRFGWEYVSRADGAVAGGGTEFMLLSPEGRIRADYQFIEA